MWFVLLGLRRVGMVRVCLCVCLLSVSESDCASVCVCMVPPYVLKFHMSFPLLLFHYSHHHRDIVCTERFSLTFHINVDRKPHCVRKSTLYSFLLFSFFPQRNNSSVWICSLFLCYLMVIRGRFHFTIRSAVVVCVCVVLYVVFCTTFPSHPTHIPQSRAISSKSQYLFFPS